MISSLGDFKAYELAMKLGDDVWKVVSDWRYFEKDTIGKQLVKAADSVAANLSEGFGRYHFKEAKNFSYFSRGSLFETETWLTKAHARELITTDQYQHFKKTMDTIGKMLNGYISSLGKANHPNARCLVRPVVVLTFLITFFLDGLVSFEVA
jgi:four helix bundle protein